MLKSTRRSTGTSGYGYREGAPWLNAGSRRDENAAFDQGAAHHSESHQPTRLGEAGENSKRPGLSALPRPSENARGHPLELAPTRGEVGDLEVTSGTPESSGLTCRTFGVYVYDTCQYEVAMRKASADLLGLTIREPGVLHRKVQEGLPYAALERFHAEWQRRA